MASSVFHLIAVVSNGYLLGTRDGLADWLASFDNVCVQISIDGRKEFHDTFRKKAGSFEACCEAIRRLKRHGIIVRVAMSVTPENIDQVEDVFLLSKELGADAFSPAAITSFGRAANLGMCAEKDHELQRSISKILAPYATDPLLGADRMSLQMSQRNKAINCGAGWRSFALSGATGEIRSCLFLATRRNSEASIVRTTARFSRASTCGCLKMRPRPHRAWKHAVTANTWRRAMGVLLRHFGFLKLNTRSVLGDTSTFQE